MTLRLFCLLAVMMGFCWASAASASPSRSIRGWVTCNGSSDDSLGVASAFKAARNNAFTLVVDCPVRLHIATDFTRTVFIDNGTTVEFSGAGKFTVDNVMVPAFVIANSSDITLSNWNVEYDASLPVDWNVGGFEENGKFIASSGHAPPAVAFNNLGITRWLAANRKITFERPATSLWDGPTNSCAMFFIAGDTSNVTVSGMKLYVPQAAGGNRFIPMAFSFSADYLSNQTVNPSTPITARYVAVPHDLTFSDIDLDGIYMGWQGNVRNVVFDHIRSHRYGDLQDANGQNVGGIGKWFAPPHLFYLSYAPAGDPLLFNQDIYLTDVVDAGPRVGVARDKQGENESGYALSLKLGCNDCSVSGYVSNRPDGFMDVLTSNNLTISNVTATYDSAFTNNLYPGMRFPMSGYKNITFENLMISDTAASSVQLPIGNAGSSSNENLVFKNVKAVINRWSGTGLPFPSIWGDGNSLSFDYSLTGNGSRMVRTQAKSLQVTLQAAPNKLKVGDSTALSWASREANSCSGAGAWNGARSLGGSTTIKPSAAGNMSFTLYCQNSSASSSVALPVVVE